MILPTTLLFGALGYLFYVSKKELAIDDHFTSDNTNENDDLYLEKVKEMTEYYMEVDRVLGKMGTHLQIARDQGHEAIAEWIESL